MKIEENSPIKMNLLRITQEKMRANLVLLPSVHAVEMRELFHYAQ